MDETMNHVAHVERETEATHSRALLEQSFSPTVAEYLQQHPECLTGQLREGDASVCRLVWVRYDGGATLSGRLLRTVGQGYGVAHRDHSCPIKARWSTNYGDGLLALWNAPLDQADHATLACTAAQEMLDSLPTASNLWRHRLSEPLQMSIGIHTGPDPRRQLRHSQPHQVCTAGETP